MSETISKVLVANRGEIAVRVLQGAARMGYPTVAVYSDADANALHVQTADQAVNIGPPPAADSYLNIEAIIQAAQATGANAIHPGYGFLAENADFARAIYKAGLIFIGPTADAIDLMGNKRAAKERMEAAGVPCIPGFKGGGSDAELASKADETGFPIMVKAAAGGGGRGMRLVDNASDLTEAIKSAKSEAKSAFGNDEIILEKAVTGARHVEIQVLADTHGNVIHLGERDCSIQRRHQKVVEESPCPVADDSLRQAMGEAAVNAARAINYRGAGTVEFLLDSNHKFYFLEMNTRLQVEHPVTELVTGIDLVEWQLRVAAGEKLAHAQPDVQLRGHAIEVRLCAEDPANDFLPQTGPVVAWQAPTGEGIRVDYGLRSPGEVSPYYDSMQAKLVAYGPDRETARRRLLQALDDCVFFGLPSNLDFLRVALAHLAFAEGDFDTGFIAEHMPEPAACLPAPDSRHFALAAALLYSGNTQELCKTTSIGAELLDWHSSNPTPTLLTLRYGRSEEKIRLTVEAQGPNRYQITLIAEDEDTQSTQHCIELQGQTDYRIRFTCDSGSGQANFARRENQLMLDAYGATVAYDDVTLAATETRGNIAASGEIKANSDGKIMAVKVQAGDHVERGQTLLVLEAMKMEFQVASEVDGEVTSVLVAAGDQVAARQLLVSIAASGENE